METCYGIRCRRGSFESPNFSNFPPDNVYPNNHIQLYLLYIPGATEILFYFDPIFNIEYFKDELYIGSGLQFSYAELNGRSDLEPPIEKYFFDGNQKPDNFTLRTDTAWVSFRTDRTIQERGFKLYWNTIGKCLWSMIY